MLRTFFLAWAALAVLVFAWVIATPLGASPDEPAHIIRAASVAQGQILGAPTTAGAITRVEVPRDIADATKWPCSAFGSNKPASCQTAAMFQTGSQLESATTSAGLYDPVYYALVGWPSLFLFTPHAAVLAMRMVSALISTGLLALAFVMITRMRTSWPIRAGFLVAFTPMAVFLTAAVNPNSLEYCAGLAFFATGIYLVRDGSRVPTWPVLSALIVSGVLLAQARSLSPLWLAVCGVLVLIYAGVGRVVELFRTPRFLIAIGAVVLGTIPSLVWTVATGTLSQMGTYVGAGTANPRVVFEQMLMDHPFDEGWIAVFGWLDILGPEAVITIWFGLMVGAIVAAFTVARGRRLLAVILAVATLFVAPAALQAASVRASGMIWQGRYILIIFMCLVVLCGIVVADRIGTDRIGTAGIGRRVLITIAVITTAAQLWCFTATLARYTVGVNNARSILWTPLWQPPGGVVLSLVLAAVGALAVAAVAVWVGRSPHETSGRVPPAASPVRDQVTTPTV
jgi:hypothetical protein